MVLRFTTGTDNPRHIAFCSSRQTWTDKAPNVSYAHEICVSEEDFMRIKQEIDFRCYDYSETLE